MQIVIVSSGQVLSNVRLYAGDVEYVLSGGVSIQAQIAAGGNEFVFSSGTVSATLLMGSETVQAGGTAHGTQIGSGGLALVQAGGLSVAASAGLGGDLVVSDGVARGAVVGSGGFVLVDGTGRAIGTQVQDGGTLIVLPGAIASATKVQSGGHVQSGGVVILSAHHVVAAAAGTLSGGHLDGNSQELVLSGGMADRAVIDSGVQQVRAGGVAHGTTVSGGAQYVLSGGVAYGTRADGGVISAGSGGAVSGARLGDQGVLFIGSGAQAVAAQVSSGGSAVVQSGGLLLRGVDGLGGATFVQSGGLERGGVVSAGGLDDVAAGTASGTVVKSGGQQYVAAGRAVHTVVQSGGVAVVAAPSVAGSASISGAVVQADGELVLLPGALAIGTQVSSGGAVRSGGVFVLSGARLLAQAGAGTPLLRQDVTVGAVEYVLSGGIASGGMVAGTQLVESAGVARAMQLGSGGAQIVSSGGLASGTLVGDGATVQVTLGGVASGLSVRAGGLVQVLAASVFGTRVASGGQQQVIGGVASATQIGSGGLDVVMGVSLRATIAAGGDQFVSFGQVSGSVVSSGGYLVVSTGGSATGGFVRDGGTVILLPGGTASGVGVEAGGRIQSGGVVVMSAQHVLADAGPGLSGGVFDLATVEYALSGGVATGGIVHGRQVVGSGGTSLRASADGLIQVQAGGVASAASLTGGGVLLVAGSVVSAELAGGASATIASGAVADGTMLQAGGSMTVLSGGSASGTSIGAGAAAFVASGGVQTAVQLAEGGTLVLQDFGFVGSATASFDAATDVLSVTAGGRTDLVQFAGSYAGEYFHVSGGFGVGISVDGTPCFCHGTRIATPAGEVAVERLAIGDLVLTQGGPARPIRWIGRRSYVAPFATNADILPVTIAAGALGDGGPVRDLRVSPLHAMFIDGVLIPAAALVNGVTITQAAAVDRVDYVHLELDGHTILFADGAAAESYVDDDSRAMFANAAEYGLLYPHAVAGRVRFCAPRLTDGDAVAAIRRRLDPRTVGEAFAPGPLHGTIDGADRLRVFGWAHDGGPVEMELLVDGAVVARITAVGHRADVAAAGFGDGRCGFDHCLATPLSAEEPHTMALRRAADGAPLPDGTRTLPAVASLPDHVRAAVDAGVAALDASTADHPAHHATLGFLLHHVDRLRAHQADAAARRHARALGAVPPRALVIATLPPRPDDRLWQLVADLQSSGHEVAAVLATLAPCASFTAAGIGVIAAPQAGSVEEVLRRQSGGIDMVVLHGPSAAVLYGPLVRRWLPGVRMIAHAAALQADQRLADPGQADMGHADAARAIA